MTDRCKAGPGRCTSTEIDNRGEKHAGIATAGRLCEPCTAKTGRIVGNLTADWQALALLIGRDDHVEGERVAYTPTPRIPLNVGAEAQQAELLELVDIAAEMVTNQVGGYDYTPPRNLLAHLQAAIDVIEPDITALIAAPAEQLFRWDRSGNAHGREPDSYRKTGPKTYVGLDQDGNELDGRGHRWVEMSGTDVALEIWDLHARVFGMLGLSKADNRRRMPMCCHGCGNRTLYREYGEELIKCSTCPPASDAGRGWTEEQYHRLAGLAKFHLSVIEEDEMREELEAAEARAAAAEQAAADLEAKLTRVAVFAGHDSVDALMAVIDQPAA